MVEPRLAASGTMSDRTQSATADAMVQRRIAAGLTATLRLSGNTMASSRTRSSPPQAPGPRMSGIEGAIAMSSVSASRQAEACFSGARRRLGGLVGGCLTLGSWTLRRALVRRFGGLLRPRPGQGDLG